MILPLLALAAAAAAQPSEASPYFLDDSTVVQVVCEKWLGSAFYIGNGEYITARHVVRDDDKNIVKCTVHGVPITVIQVGATHDYAFFKAPYYPPYRAIISCAGFKEANVYYAQGYAMGRPWVVTQRLIGTKDYYVSQGDPMSNGVEMRGSSTEGQSGGPVSDDDGLVVGLVSAGAEGGETQEIFVSLSDTPICRAWR